MEWSNDKVRELINLFKDRPVLWDCRSKEYKDKNKRRDALQEIAVCFGVDSHEVERKFKNLVCHFLREIKKERESNYSGAESDEVYKSKWFAYNNMLFLKYRNQLKGMTDANMQDQTTTVNEDIMQICAIEHETQYADQDQRTASGSQNKRLTRSRSAGAGLQKRQKISAPAEEEISIPREIQGLNVTSAKDQFQAFGDQVGLRIRDLQSSTAQKIVKHLIGNILFEAEMGKYDNSNNLFNANNKLPFNPIPNYVQHQFSVPNLNQNSEQPSYSGQMPMTSTVSNKCHTICPFLKKK